MERYLDLKRYVGWSDSDAHLVRTAGKVIAPHFGELVDDFYDEVERHEATRRVITGGSEQIARLKTTLLLWLNQLFEGPYDANYVEQRRRVGLKHVQIGLAQVYTEVALSRLRNGMLGMIGSQWPGDAPTLVKTLQAVNRLLDLDLAIVCDAYESERLSKLQRAERERSDAVFRDLVEAAGCLILILRDDGSIAFFNSFAEQLTGYRVDEVINQDCVNLLYPDGERAAMRKMLSQAMSGEHVRGIHNEIVRRDGARRSMLLNARRLDTYEPQPVVLVVGQDITSLQSAQAKALQAERLATIGQMSAGLAHESRNALQRIQACTEVLELEVADNEVALSQVRRIQAAEDHMHRLFDEIRGFAAPITPDRSECRLADVWREAWELLAPQRVGRDARLHEPRDANELRLSIDRFRMVQVFRNVLENALAACSDPVHITIALHPLQLAGQPAVRVVVRDNGPGMTPQQRERVFEAFFTTKPKGTGLGMPIAQRIVEAHGGRIDIASRHHAPRHGVAHGMDTPVDALGAEVIIDLPREAPPSCGRVIDGPSSTADRIAPQRCGG